MNEDAEFVYVGDPMCSWCWGFAPVVDQLTDRYQLPVRLVVGGLRPGPSAQVMDDHLKRFLAQHWDQVSEVSGQPFNHGLFEREGWRYDTELPAIGVVTMRRLNETEALRFFHRLQEAFYVENVDVTNPDVYPELLDGFDANVDEFLDQLRSEAMRQAAWQDFSQARELGVMGFPTLLVRAGGWYDSISRGYAPIERIDAVMQAWQSREKATG